MKYPFEKLLLVCVGKRCNDKEHGDDRGEVIQEELKALNKRLARKALVRVCQVSCLDLCDHGPNLVEHPEGRVYSHLDRANAVAVYHGIMGEAPRCDELELTDAELRAGSCAARK